jgi:DNA-directed RNA polymerase specialized sigma24 family protein
MSDAKKAPTDVHDDIVEDDAYTVRPYAVSGGRTRPSSDRMPVEALVQALSEPSVGLTPERRQILELTATQYLSVAELSAHLRLPVGVVRVLLSDLSDEQRVRVHGLTPTSDFNPAASLSVLESVLNGISSL